jgi:AcrR family transcriptional regulator
MTHDTAQKVLQAASELFAERGYAATTTRAIAERAGVNEVTLFRRFDNKLGILKALGEQWAEMQAGHAVEHAADPADTRATLLALARMEVAGAQANGGAAMRLAFEARSVPEVAALMGEGPRSNMDGLAHYLAQRQAAGDLRGDLSATTMAEAFFSLTSSYVMYRMMLGSPGAGPEAHASDTVGELVELFWTGVEKR